MTQQSRSKLRGLVSFVSGGYALLLGIYLVVRLLLGDSLWWTSLFNNFVPVYFVPLLVLLPIALLARARRGIILSGLMLLVGGLMYAPLYIHNPARTVAQADETLEVISFNMYFTNPYPDAVEDFLREQAADIVVMQEVVPEREDTIMANLRDAYPHQAQVGGNFAVMTNRVLSRHPFAEPPVEGDGRVVLDVAGEQVAVHAVHAPVPMGNYQVAAAARLGLVGTFFRYDPSWRDDQIRMVVSRAENESMPVIVAGDFNMSDQSELYHEVAAVLKDSYRDAGRGLGMTFPAALLGQTLVPVVRIDYIWHSDDWRAVTAERVRVPGADHLALVATLDWE